MGWLGDGSHRWQVCQAWTAVGLPPRYPRQHYDCTTSPTERNVADSLDDHPLAWMRLTSSVRLSSHIWHASETSIKRCSHCARHRTTALDALTHDICQTTQRHRTMSDNFYMQIAVPCRCRTMSYDVVRYVNSAVKSMCSITATSSDVVCSVNTA